MHQYQLIYTREGDWAVALPLDNDHASVVAHSPDFPKSRLELEFAENGWDESDYTHVIGAMHQTQRVRCALEDAVAEVKRLAEEYSQ